MAFSPPVVGCLVEKGWQKGGSWAPQDPPGYALVVEFKGAIANNRLSMFPCVGHLQLSGGNTE